MSIVTFLFLSFLSPQHDPEDDEQRYVPDYNVLELKAQRDNIESGKLMKKKKV